MIYHTIHFYNSIIIYTKIFINNPQINITMCLTHKKSVINCNILSDARLENLAKLGKLTEGEVKETITYSNALRGERSSGPQTLMSNSTLDAIT